MLLEAFANNVFSNRAVHEVVTKLNRVHEFVGGNQRNLLSGNEHDGERHGQSDEQPHNILRDAPGADIEHDLGIELGREPCASSTKLPRAVARPSIAFLPY